VHRSVTLEFGTASDTRQIIAGRAEHWVYRRGDRRHHVHAQAIKAHRDGYTPDDATWERNAMAQGRSVLDAALVAVGSHNSEPAHRRVGERAPVTESGREPWGPIPWSSA